MSALAKILTFGLAGDADRTETIVIAAWWLMVIFITIFLIMPWGKSMLSWAGIESMTNSNINNTASVFSSKHQPRSVNISGFVSNKDVMRLAAAQATGR